MGKTYMPSCSRIFFVFIFIATGFLHFNSKAQNNSVTIGGTEIKQDAVLYLIANGDQGLILPSVSNVSSFAASSPGMVVYNQADNRVYYFTGSQWIGVGNSSSSGTDSYSLRLQGNNLELLLNNSVQDQL